MIRSCFRLFAIVSLICGIASCSSYHDDASDASEERSQLTDVTITFTDLDINIVPDVSRATASEAKLSRILLTIFDASGNSVYTTTQTSSDANFGTISTPLHVGSYTFSAVAVGSTESTIAIADNATATFSSNPPFATYSTTKEVTIAGNSSQEVTMAFGKRITTTLGITITDDTPAEVQNMQIIVSPSASKSTSYSIDPSTGFASDTWRYERTIEKATTFTGTKYGLMFFLTSATQHLDFTVNMLSATGEVLYTRTKTGVTFNKSASTNATGTFFSSTSGITFTFDTAEAPSTEISLN